MAKRKLTDGTEHAAHVLFDSLVECELRGGQVHVTARSKDYQRSGVMTLEYTRTLFLALGQCLTKAGQSLPMVDDIAFLPEGTGVRYVLVSGGKQIATGAVSEAAARKAKSFLDKHFDGPNLVRGPWKKSG